MGLPIDRNFKADCIENIISTYLHPIYIIPLSGIFYRRLEHILGSNSLAMYS